MLRNYLLVAVRNLRRHAGYTTINVAGLSVGLVAGLLILLYVQDERSYDRYHADADRVYRVTAELLDEAGAPQVHLVLIDPPIGPLLEAEFPEVRAAARLTPVGPLLSVGDRHIEPEHTYWADPDVFEVFTFQMLAGDPRTALTTPFSLTLSASTARVLFGGEDALGKTVLVNGEDAFAVTGVFADPPPNTHLPVDVLGSMASLEAWFGPLGWESPNYATYLRLAEGASPERLERGLGPFLARHADAPVAARRRLHLQALTDIHLRSNLVGELAPNGDIRYVRLFGVVALLILFTACVNFTNLATARAAQRGREVGVRKAVGAHRRQLVGQFLGEATLLTLLALALAVGLVALALPAFNAFTGKALALGDDLPRRLAALAAVGLTVGLAAGAYPAFVLSGFRPVAALRGRLVAGRRAPLRAVLVVAQFVIALVLMVGTAVVYRQLAFVRSQNLGFDREHVLILPPVWDLLERFDPLRDALLRHPDVIDVAQSNPAPAGQLMFSTEVSAQQGDDAPPRTATLYAAFADAHFFPTYRIPFAAGASFAAADERPEAGFVLNESAVRQLGWTAPEAAVGATLTLGGWRGPVLGVVRDFHFESLHQAVAPMAFYQDPRNYRAVSVRYRPGADLAGLLAFLEAQWQAHAPNTPLSYEFLDERFGAAYASDRKLGQIVGLFAGLAVLITCLGLLGMAAFTVERRTKEIGIRKALGATAADVVALLSKDLVRLVLAAFVVATPVAYLAVSRWLEGFAYRVPLGPGVFLAAGALALLIALATVAGQALRAASADPVKALRYE